MRVIYMGTPDFAVPALKALIDGGQEVVAVVTQPDKPKGRGKTMQFTPVKEVALEYGLPVYQPININEDVERLKELAPDIIIVAAFGQVLKEEILKLPKYGCINIHASLLPKLRGAAPIQFAVIEGHKQAGVTIMQMAKGLDTGDMIAKQAIEVDEKETGGSLHDKLSVIGGELLMNTLKEIENNSITPIPQGEDYTYAGMLTKSMGEINWNQDATVIERLIRGLNPWPSAYTYLGEKMLKIWSADVDCEVTGTPGTIVDVTKKNFTVATGKGGLVITSLQLQGKKQMESDAFLRGVKLEVGMKLGR